MRKMLIILVMTGMLISAGGCEDLNCDRKAKKPVRVVKPVNDTTYRAGSVQIFFTLHPEFGSPSNISTVPTHCYQNYQFRVQTNTNRYFLVYLKRDGRIVSVDEITKTGRKNWR